MPNKNYQRGRAREYKQMDDLKKEGYGLVMRTAGSHSPVDVIAIYETFMDPQYGLCFRGKLFQLKTSVKLKNLKVSNTVLDTPSGTILVERREYPTYVRKPKKDSKSKLQTQRKKPGGVGRRKPLSRKNRAVPVRRRTKGIK